jgi:hypothetical protein
MKKTIVILGMLILSLTFFGVANATLINDPWVGNTPEQNLYFIYNNLFGTSFSASNDITQLSQPGPWTAGNWGVNVVVKFAGSSQTLGTSATGDLVPTVTANGYGFLNTTFLANSDFTWYDRSSLSTPDSNSNQFVAFQLSSPEITYLNDNFGTSKDPNGLVYLIAFEDNPTGDFDYNDLLAVVENTGRGGAVPEPATMLLLGSGLLGMGVFVRRRFSKK